VTRDTPRIDGGPVHYLAPAEGPVHVLLVGEAPGPRGADKSGVPFLGDRAGRPLYAAMVAAGVCTLPEGSDDVPWDGRALREAGVRPVLRGVALTNAYDVCPTDDGVHFRAPKRRELASVENLARLAHELDLFAARGLRRVVTLGAVATRTLRELADTGRWDGLAVDGVPHPSAQGLLGAAPDRGRGLRLEDLAAAWQADLVRRLREACA
jgi:uracil-DNA glycosylase